MIQGLMNYGALTTKAKALYGKRLRLADYTRMAALHAPEEVAEYLRGCPAWAAAARRLPPGSFIGRIELERALWQQFRADYLSLCHYLPRRDRDLMEFPVLLHEQRIILFALRQLQSGRPFPAPPSTGLGSLNWKALYACTDLDGLIAAADQTIFAPALRRLRPAEGGLPDYTRTEVLLHSVYFSHMYRVIHRNYTGETERVLLRSYGEQIDLMNLMHILRLKAFFPQVRDYLPLLFPFNYRLRPEKIQALCAAPDMAAVLSLLSDTPYAKAFAKADVSQLEDYYSRAFYAFNRRLLTGGPPSVCAAVAYLNLKELELQTLVGVVEAVKYGVPCDLSMARLIGA